MPAWASGRAVDGVGRACYSAGDDLGAVRDRFLRTLRRVVPFDAAFMAGADPESLLFTTVFADDPLRTSAPQFLDNEFGADADVNRFVDLARAIDPVGSLDDATGGERGASARWRDIMGPIGMGDEMRVALRVDGTTWGFLCLHRSGVSGFTPGEMAVLRTAAPHVGEALRRLAVDPSAAAGAASAQAVVLVADHIVLAVAGAVDQLGGDPLVVGRDLPLPLAAVVRRLEAIEGDHTGIDVPTAAIRMTSHGGALVTAHAARLHDASGTGPVVLTIGPATSAERSSLLLAARGLTPAQSRVAKLVLRGCTTSQIVVELHISAHTVQDHLKAVFDKVGVRSRRELVSAFMHPTH